MKNMRILLDTNVFIDYLMAREPFKASAEYILNSCIANEIEGCIAAHSISNLFYILRKSYTVDERRDMISVLRKIITRNLADFKYSTITAISPDEFVSKYMRK